MIESWRRISRRILPDRVVRVLRHGRDMLRPLPLSGPVAQIYINDGDVRSFASLNNFMSFMVAGVRTNGELNIELYGADGARIHRAAVPLAHFSSQSFDIGEILDTAGISSELGIVTLCFRPEKLRRAEYKKLGMISSHFFMFYRSRSGSLAMVHPSSVIEPDSQIGAAFLSNQLIDTRSLEAVTLYQCNPAAAMHTMTVGLQDAETSERLACEELVLPPLSARSVVFDTRALSAAGRTLRVFSSSLPTLNSKPMLRRCYSDGRFSMSHS